MKERLIAGAGFWTATSVVLIATFGAVIALPFMRSPTPHAAPVVAPASALPAAAHAPTRAKRRTIDYEREYEAAAAAMIARSRSAAKSPPRAAPSTASGGTTEEPIDPIELGRAALNQVGLDSDAEDMWLAIINDPSIDAEDRKDLIEDLNEEGFADPEHLTPADLPLIEARLALLEKLLPEPMDDTNAAAFAEARKDLLEMRNKLRPAPIPEAPPASK